MSEEVTSEAVKATQLILGKHVKRPPLSEKLLKRPPFRFLHDIVISIVGKQNFLNGLFTPEELDSKNVANKEAKIAFLDKLIGAIKTKSGENISARSGKIVSGLEVNKTLELLQALGRVLERDKVEENGVENGGGAARRELNSDKIEETKKKSRKASAVENGKNRGKSSAGESEAKSSKENGTNKISSMDENESVGKIVHNASDGKGKEDRKGKGEKISRKRSKEMNDTEVKISENVGGTTKARKDGKMIAGKGENENDRKRAAADGKSEKRAKADKNENKIKIGEEEVEMPQKTDKNENHRSQKIIAKNERTKRNGKIEKGPEVINGEGTKAISARPPSARPGSRKPSLGELPEMKEKDAHAKPRVGSAAAIRPKTAARPPSARPGAPRVRDKGEISVPIEETAVPDAVNVIEEGNAGDLLSEEKDDLIVIEDVNGAPPILETNLLESERGQLVNQILQTQLELTDGKRGKKNYDIDWEGSRQKERETTAKEMDILRSHVQTLTSAVNPLAKIIDYLREDTEEMKRELARWKERENTLRGKIAAETESMESSLKPLRKELENVEENIEEERAKISQLKGKIFENDEKLEKIVAKIYKMK